MPSFFQDCLIDFGSEVIVIFLCASDGILKDMGYVCR